MQPANHEATTTVRTLGRLTRALRKRAIASIFFSVVLLGAVAHPASAASVAIVTGGWYTPNAKNALIAAGHTVTEVSSYTAASLAPFDAVLHYGNSHTDFAALETYVQGGGVLVETPWLWLNWSPTPNLRIFTQGGGATFQMTYPGVTALLPSDPLLDGVTFPAPGAFNIGRTSGNGFAPGVTAIANWADGTAMLGTKLLGAGIIVGINLHVITSDTAYQVVNQAWASTLLSNAVGGIPCGDGQLDAGEACDDGNLADGDCCSSTCQFEVAGSACASDDNACTNDVCDGAGACEHNPNAAPCNDGDACTVGDVCSSGVCTAGSLVTTCADGDACCIAGCTASVDTDCPAQEILEYVSTIYDDSIDPINGVNGLFSGTDIALSPDGQHIYVAAYTDNLVSVFERDALTGEATWVEAEAGANSALVRVAGVIVSPDGEHVYAANDFYAQSGVSLFDRNPVTGELTYVAVYRQAGFEGARQMVISPDGTNLYAIAGLDQIVVYSRNSASGVLTSIQTLTDGVDGVDGIDNTWELAISPDGAHVYVIGFDDDAVAIFSRDAGTGELTYVTALFDNTPGYAFLARADGVAVSGDGRFVYVNSFDEDVNVFLRDADTGLLTFVERFPAIGGPGKLVVSPDDGRIYTSAWVSALDAYGRDLVSDTHSFLETKLDGVDGVTGIEGMQGIAVSPDGQDVYVGSFYDRALTHFRVRCGNGVLEVGEACDDGNGTGGDGCASNCTVEFCWTCTAVPAVQSVCAPDDGKVCNDGLYCTGAGGDTCQAGVCTGPARTCDDANQCTADSCDESANACVNDAPILNGAACEDGAYCTVGDSCLTGACQPGGARECGDTEDCTVDSCNEAADACAHTPKPDGNACVSGASCTVDETCTAGVCGDGTLDAASCADHYLCYKAGTTPGAPSFAPIAGVPLADAFESVDTDVRKPTQLCTPADKNGEGILDAVSHLEGYLVKTAKGEPKHIAQIGLSVTDQFGSLVVDTLKPRQLLLPTSKALGSPAGPLPSTSKVDHYKCYKIRLSASSPAFPTGLQATLEDQFTAGDPKLFDVRKPKALCVPVDKNGEGIIEPLANLMCYQVKPAKGEPRHDGIEGEIHTSNQFGDEQLDTKKEDVLCVPALVAPAP